MTGIMISILPKMNDIQNIGSATPGPLLITKSGLTLKNTQSQNRSENRVVKTAEKYDCPTCLLLGISQYSTLPSCSNNERSNSLCFRNDFSILCFENLSPSDIIKVIR